MTDPTDSIPEDRDRDDDQDEDRAGSAPDLPDDEAEKLGDFA